MHFLQSSLIFSLLLLLWVKVVTFFVGLKGPHQLLDTNIHNSYLFISILSYLIHRYVNAVVDAVSQDNWVTNNVCLL
jgi:hypothetical protein